MNVEVSPSVVKGRVGDEVEVTCTLLNTDNAQVHYCLHLEPCYLLRGLLIRVDFRTPKYRLLFYTRPHQYFAQSDSD